MVYCEKYCDVDIISPTFHLACIAFLASSFPTPITPCHTLVCFFLSFEEIYRVNEAHTAVCSPDPAIH